ncbi:MAG: HAMP domain-containing sensor histidine kinase, partial [Candidatus Omnitrophica bacterium]|nr:HAMP domain-containing sensor histidine kinase [Candidatus Omnitrophota bacterium]
RFRKPQVDGSTPFASSTPFFTTAEDHMAKNKEKSKNDYKIIISELGVNPFHVVNIIFALVCVIPLLAVCYIVVGRHLLYDIFMGLDGAQMSIAILIALAGLFYAYSLVRNLMEKLLIYAEERRLADSEKEEFMVSVSRDLRTPLEAIKFEIGNIKAGVDNVTGGVIADTVNRCLNDTNKLADIIKNIMDFPNAGFVRTNVQRKLVDLRGIVRDELSGVEQFAKNNNLHLSPRFSTKNANLWGDEKKLSRMTTSLIHNVIKSTPQGGVINVSVSSDDDTVRLVLGSGGPGPKDLVEEISVAKDIVELHSGRLTVDNGPDKELEFNIVLPRDLRTRKGVAGFRRNMRDRVDSGEDESISAWLAMNKAPTGSVSKTNTTK